MASLLPGLWRTAFDLGLRKKVAIVFTGILMFAAVNLGLLHGMLQDFNGVAATATVAGKLRMLGQKLAFEAVSVSTGLSGAPESIERDIVDFEAAYLTLRSGGSAFNESIRPLSAERSNAMNGVWLAWKQYRHDLRFLVITSGFPVAPEELWERQLAVATSANTVLEHTDILIAELVQEAQDTQAQVLRRMYVLLGLNAL